MELDQERYQKSIVEKKKMQAKLKYKKQREDGETVKLSDIS